MPIGTDGANAVRTAPPSEAETKEWLVRHYSHAEKMRQDRIRLLLAERDKYSFLKPAITPKLYRGLFNVTKQTLEKLKKGEETDATKDKSWTTSKSVAWQFARGEFADTEPIDGRFAVVLSAPMPSGRALLNAKLAAKEPGIGDQWNEVWGETLESAIKNEREVLVSGAISVGSVDHEPLATSTNARASMTNAYFDDYSMNDGVSPYMEDGVLYIPIMDVIADRWFGVSAKSIKKAVARYKDAERIVLQIDSPGGDVTQGTTIYGILRAAGKPVEAQVYGMAASMASVIMLAADKRVMLPGSMVMIHEPWTIAIGDSSFFEKEAELLDKIAGSMLKIYADRTGGSAEELRKAMKAETWLTAEEAVDWGFAGAVVDGSALKSVPDELAANAEWNARRGLMLSTFKNAPDDVSAGSRLGWNGPSREDLLTSMKSLPAAASFGDAMSNLMGVMGGKPPEPKPPTRSSQAPDLGTLRIQVSVSEPKAQAEPKSTPTEASPPPREEPTSGTNEKQQMQNLKDIAALLGLSADATAEDITAALARSKAEKERLEQEHAASQAEAAAARVLAEQREKERLEADAQARVEAVRRDEMLAMERRLHERATFDAEVKAAIGALTPAMAKVMEPLCYVADESHPSGKSPNKAGFEAMKKATEALPAAQKEHYTGSNNDLTQALANAGAAPQAGGTSIFSVFKTIEPDEFQAHQAKLRARAAREKRNDVNFTA